MKLSPIDQPTLRKVEKVEIDFCNESSGERLPKITLKNKFGQPLAHYDNSDGWCDKIEEVCMAVFRRDRLEVPKFNMQA
ncbi:MAG: hypothetical protein A2Y25_09075 [Candidatus Melainabacteria bacterium GWF2_37_15]|nr:MAG: hypothetical protein A2Y25_09075 [Candidatus Melainabacteria bacterium GWF2_37_15]